MGGEGKTKEGRRDGRVKGGTVVDRMKRVDD